MKRKLEMWDLVEINSGENRGLRGKIVSMDDQPHHWVPLGETVSYIRSYEILLFGFRDQVVSVKEWQIRFLQKGY